MLFQVRQESSSTQKASLVVKISHESRSSTQSKVSSTLRAVADPHTGRGSPPSTVEFTLDTVGGAMVAGVCPRRFER